jgi:hypothetical protein
MPAPLVYSDMLDTIIAPKVGPSWNNRLAPKPSLSGQEVVSRLRGRLLKRRFRWMRG